MKKVVLSVCCGVLILLTGCGARSTMTDMSYYKAGVEHSSKSYAEETYGSTITVEEALKSLGMQGLEEGTEYYEGFEDMIDALNKSSKEDLIEYYTEWNWLNKTEKLSASFMVMFGIIDIDEYAEGVQNTINEYIGEIEEARG